MNMSTLSALSGLQAAQRRFELSAGNVVNSRTEGYLPHRVQTITNENGGTRAVAVPVKPASVPFFDFDGATDEGGAVATRPNVALEREAVEQILAQRAFEANLRTIETANDMTKALLDTVA